MNCACDQPGLRSYEAGLAQLIAAAQPVQDYQVLALEDALGKVLAEDVVSTIMVPPAANSAMDGYAMRAADIVANEYLPISQRINAGATPEPLQPGTIARIFTGAEIPAGADCVVMQEIANAQESSDGKAIVAFQQVPSVGDHIRPAGQDITEGAQIASVGECISPRLMGVLASVGKHRVKVRPAIKVAVLNTGDELVMPGEPCAPGKIYNSNLFTLTGLLKNMGCELVAVTQVPDTPEATRAALMAAAAEADVILSSGGVSVGDEDHVKGAVEELGELHLWRLAIKPGKPLAFGHVNNTPFIGLPGNPSAVLVTFLMLARPYLMAMQGRSKISPQRYHVPAGFERLKGGPRTEFLRVSLTMQDGQTSAQLLTNQSSGVLSSATLSDGLLILPQDTTVQLGDMLEFIPFAELGAA